MRDTMRLDLRESDLQIIVRILSLRLPERPVYAFGSRATGKARRSSDLDLAIGGSAPLTLRQRALLTGDFEESDLPIEVDFVDLNAIAPEFQRRIERDFIVVQAGSSKPNEVRA